MPLYSEANMCIYARYYGWNDKNKWTIVFTSAKIIFIMLK